MKITRREAINAIKDMFETNTGKDDNASRLVEKEDDTATFFLDKRKYERYEIIERLSRYFDNVTIMGGQCSISPITFVFTLVKIQKRP